MSHGTAHSVDTARKRAQKSAVLAKQILRAGIPRDSIDSFIRQPGGKAQILGHVQFQRVGPEVWAGAAEIAKEFSRS